MSAKKKQVRQQFRDETFKRDGNKCRVCGKAFPAAVLDAHHITDRTEMPNGGYVKENGISLCAECHKKAEEWHSSGKTKHVEGFKPEDLYALIGSTYNEAVEASRKLAPDKEKTDGEFRGNTDAGGHEKAGDDASQGGQGDHAEGSPGSEG